MWVFLMFIVGIQAWMWCSNKIPKIEVYHGQSLTDGNEWIMYRIEVNMSTQSLFSCLIIFDHIQHGPPQLMWLELKFGVKLEHEVPMITTFFTQLPPTIHLYKGEEMHANWVHLMRRRRGAMNMTVEDKLSWQFPTLTIVKITPKIRMHIKLESNAYIWITNDYVIGTNPISIDKIQLHVAKSANK